MSKINRQGTRYQSRFVVAVVTAFQDAEVDALADKDGRQLARKVLRTAAGVDMKDPLTTMQNLGIVELIEESDGPAPVETYSSIGGDAE